LCFIHAATVAGVPEALPRPTITPDAVAARLRENLSNGG